MSSTCNAFTIIRSKFSYFAAIGGPQYAANLQLRGVDGSLEVTEGKKWQWTPSKGAGTRALTDTDLEDLVDPIEVCKNLFLAAQDSMIEMQEKMYSQIERARHNRDSALLGHAGAEAILTEVFRLPSPPAAEEPTSVM